MQRNLNKLSFANHNYTSLFWCCSQTSALHETWHAQDMFWRLRESKCVAVILCDSLSNVFTLKENVWCFFSIKYDKCCHYNACCPVESQALWWVCNSMHALTLFFLESHLNVANTITRSVTLEWTSLVSVYWYSVKNEWHVRVAHLPHVECLTSPASGHHRPSQPTPHIWQDTLIYPSVSLSCHIINRPTSNWNSASSFKKKLGQIPLYLNINVCCCIYISQTFQLTGRFVFCIWHTTQPFIVVILL